MEWTFERVARPNGSADGPLSKYLRCALHIVGSNAESLRTEFSAMTRAREFRFQQRRWVR